MAVNQDFINKLISLINQGLITFDDIKLQEYKDAVQVALTEQ